MNTASYILQFSLDPLGRISIVSSLLFANNIYVIICSSFYFDICIQKVVVGDSFLRSRQNHHVFLHYLASITSLVNMKA